MTDWWHEALMEASVQSDVAPLPITGGLLNTFDSPPCRACDFWRPTINANPSGWVAGNGVKCCHADQQYSDFSCFRNWETGEAE